jgi:hypothetical protein
MRVVRTLGPLLLTLALALSSTASARAEAPADLARARDLFIEGSKLSENGDWEGARDRFERSLKLKRAALTLYNLGIAQQETGHLLAAVDSFRAFLALPVEPATQVYVEPVRTVVAMLETRVAQVEVDVRPVGIPGLVLRIDGREAATTSGWRRMDPGHHDFTASAPGFCDAAVTESLAEGARSTVAIRLAPGALAPTQSAKLPIALAASGVALLVGGGIALGVGAAGGLRASPDGAAPKVMLAGGVAEGAGAVALGAAAVVLLTRLAPRAQKAAVVPWAQGAVGGVAVRF